MSSTPTTLIDAVNIILDGIGEAPTNSLISSSLDVNNALARIEESLQSILGKGLWFNTETITITPNVDGEYVLPVNALEAKPVDFYDRDFVQRGNRLYDRTNNRYDGNTDDLKVEVILALDFEELPDVARRAVMVKAGRKFANRVIGSTELYRLIAGDEGEAMAQLMSRNLEHERWNMADSSTMSRVLARRRV